MASYDDGTNVSRKISPAHQYEELAVYCIAALLIANI